jgi:hypothetical protein
MDWVVIVISIGIVLRHVFFVWPEDPRPLAKVYDLDAYRKARR